MCTDIMHDFENGRIFSSKVKYTTNATNGFSWFRKLLAKRNLRKFNILFCIHISNSDHFFSGCSTHSKPPIVQIRRFPSQGVQNAIQIFLRNCPSLANFCHFVQTFEQMKTQLQDQLLLHNIIPCIALRHIFFV